MLVFKDSILGFVAGFQLAENDLVRRGDWIVLPGGMVNGVVEDITLDTVKVRNFDHTLISLPPYTLVSFDDAELEGNDRERRSSYKTGFPYRE